MEGCKQGETTLSLLSQPVAPCNEGNGRQRVWLLQRNTGHKERIPAGKARSGCRLRENYNSRKASRPGQLPDRRPAPPLCMLGVVVQRSERPQYSGPPRLLHVPTHLSFGQTPHGASAFLAASGDRPLLRPEIPHPLTADGGELGGRTRAPHRAATAGASPWQRQTAARTGSERSQTSQERPFRVLGALGSAPQRGTERLAAPPFVLRSGFSL